MRFLIESENNKVIGYRSISFNELDKLLNNEVIEGQFDNASEIQNDSDLSNVVGFFKDKYAWKDSSHEILIKCSFNEDEIVGYGKGKYFASNDFAKSNIWTGRRGKVEYNLDEFYVDSYNLNNLVCLIELNDKIITEPSYKDNHLFYKFNLETQKKYFDKIKELNIPIELFR